MVSIISLWEFLDWLFYGLVRYVLWWIPVVQPFPVDRSVPRHWWEYNTWTDWYLHLDGNKRPDEHWCRQWLEMTFGEFKRLVADVADSFTRSVRDALLRLIGYVRSGYASLGQWVDKIEERAGTYLPWFASTLSGGLTFLFNLLPTGIRQQYQSWDDLFRGIRDGAVAIVRNLIDEARRWASEARSWIFTQGQHVYEFYTDVQRFVRDFKNDPRGTITRLLGSAWTFLAAFALSPVGIVLSWLGPDWQGWVTFNAGPAAFLYNLWSTHHDEIARLFSEPREWVMSRLEQAIMDRW